MNGPIRIARQPGDRPLVAAHRGLSAAAPENTLAAFRLALEAGADVLELDVHLTRDDRVAVIHDRTLQRTTTGNGRVRNYTSTEIAVFDAGSWFDHRFASERVPMLDEVLRLARDRCWVNVELKSHLVSRESPAQVVHHVLEVVRDLRMLDRVLFSSFDPGVLRILKQFEPTATTGSLYTWHRDLFRSPSQIAAIGEASVFICSRSELTDRRLRDAREAGLAVAVYTVNDPAEAVHLAKRRVDMIISDTPDQVLRALTTR